MNWCYPENDGLGVRPLPGWPRPGSLRIGGGFFLNGSQRSNAFAETLAGNEFNLDNLPMSAWSYCFLDGSQLYMLTRFATAAVVTLKHLPHYIKFTMEPFENPPGTLRGFIQEGFHFIDDEWREVESASLVAEADGWANFNDLTVESEPSTFMEWNQWNNMQPPAGIPLLALPAMGPGGGFPWPPPGLPF